MISYDCFLLLKSHDFQCWFFSPLSRKRTFRGC